jgi:putative ABC transport system substrate-binding protein
MKRREFITLLGGAAVVGPLAAGAQQPAMPVIGLLHSVSFESYADRVAAFRQGLKDMGFVEGQNVTILYRAANAQYERLPELAADLVGQRAAVIVAFAPQSAQAARTATSTIPIVFIVGIDALELGLVERLNRPEANVTGVSLSNAPLAPKRLELISELVPGARAIGFLLDPGSLALEADARDLLAAARSIGRQGVVLKAGTEREIEAAFATMVQQGVAALIVSNSTIYISRPEQIVSLASRYALPTIFAAREAVIAGGLLSYAPKVDDMYRQAGVYAGRILKGERPADLPVVQPTKFELVINLKTAKAIGLTIPEAFLLRADEVIE